MKTPQRRGQSDSDSPQQHPGFDEHGHYFTSELTVTNQYTRWVWAMCRRIRGELLTPARVILAASKDEPWVGKLFHPQTVLAWFELDRFHLWPLAGSNSQLERTLMQQGRKDPPWNDEYSWSRACDMAEELHGHPSRFEGVDMTDPGKLLRQMLHDINDLDAATFDARMQAEKDRQLQAATSAGLL